MLNCGSVVSTNSGRTSVNWECQFCIIGDLSIHRFYCIESKILGIKTSTSWLNILSIDKPMGKYFNCATGLTNCTCERWFIGSTRNVIVIWRESYGNTRIRSKRLVDCILKASKIYTSELDCGCSLYSGRSHHYYRSHCCWWLNVWIDCISKLVGFQFIVWIICSE